MTVIKPIERLAIVNRGEAAMRCIRAVKAMRKLEGSSVLAIAFYTAPDRNAPFVRHADLSHPLPMPNGAVSSYLDRDLLIDALHELRADAVWPGWGFVAEDPVFADRVVEAGMRFLGPSGDTMRKLGDKISSKLLAESAQVPVTAWSGCEVEDLKAARHFAPQIGYPLVVKASAGGGGRGIRMVDEPEQLEVAFESAASEARNAFGDGRLFLESKVMGGRHIEVQIIADMHGQVFAVGCRDCSVQRRHQKVIEEAPPSGLRAETIRALKEAAIRLAASVGYTGVGTVEFLVKDPDIYFLEMNPRLQVEHGITEEVARVDLVQEQIRVARGEKLNPIEYPVEGFAIEARVCAEDPDAGFVPAPGRIACFDPALGPRIRIDTGVVAGSDVPSEFDSLIAKVIATGRTRDEARARLSCALSDFDLVIQGGATNKGYLIDLLDAEAYRAGGVDTLWLDRWNEEGTRSHAYAVEALLVASLLAYRQVRRDALLNFYADPAGATPLSAPPSVGQQLELSFGSEQYRPNVYALGSWRYRIHLDGSAATVRLAEEGSNAVSLEIGECSLRVVFDVTETDIRVEVEGHPHRFGLQTAGQVRASTPSSVVSVHVSPGDEVEVGQTLGLLEAMKMEIGFDAPLSGVVTEVLIQKGQQVAAGEVMLVIEPYAEEDEAEGNETEAGESVERLVLPVERDPLAALFSQDGEHPLGPPDVLALNSANPSLRNAAMDGVQEEIRRILLGYDANPTRVEALIGFLEAPLPVGLSDGFRNELARIRAGICLFADVEELFIRTPLASVLGSAGLSNYAQLRLFLRRMGEEGEGLPEPFLVLLRQALAHYGIFDLSYNDMLKRAVLRLFASQRDPELRHRLVMGIVRCVMRLVDSGVELGTERTLESALTRIASMRGRLSNALADRAMDARYAIFQAPEIARVAERTTFALERWLTEAANQPSAPPVDVLQDLSMAPRAVFNRVGNWLRGPDPAHEQIALTAALWRLYAPRVPTQWSSPLGGGLHGVETAEFEGFGRVLALVGSKERLSDSIESLLDAADAAEGAVAAFELFVALDCEEEIEALHGLARTCLAKRHLDSRFSLNCVLPGIEHSITWNPEGDLNRELDLCGLHPEAAARIDLGRYRNFKLERLSGFDDVYCFLGTSFEVPEDRRFFVLADVRGTDRESGPTRVASLIPVFERAFYEATRLLRVKIGLYDPRRRLKWNRIELTVTQDLILDNSTVERLTKRLTSATRHLGLERVGVRLAAFRDSGDPEKPARPMEILLSDPTGNQLEVVWRLLKHDPLRPASAYERKVMVARSRSLIYPYEIVRMLTSTSEAEGEGVAFSSRGSGLGLLGGGFFEEFELDSSSDDLCACSVGGRAYGENPSGIVFGIISTPAEKIPEGMRRVLILSDPTKGMGSLAAPECDRVVAAIDLAENLQLPVEWVPVSSGARIAMDSGTENLDATARVVRRIVSFTQAGGVIHLIVQGVNVGAQSYWDSLSTMLMHTKGVLIMTAGASMVLTGRAALRASGSVAAEDEPSIGGYERIMGPNGQAQYYADNLGDAYRILYDYYRYSYVVPGEYAPRRLATMDSAERSITTYPYPVEEGHDFKTVGDIFDAKVNPGRKKPFAMRPLMRALIDDDGGFLERWSALAGGATAIVWDAHLGGTPVCLIGIESQNIVRWGYRPSDGPNEWNGGTLFPHSSKKVARALNSASGNRPAVILANLSGFDGSPESMRKLQLEYGAEIARAVVNFEGPLLFLVVSRYHGGAYVVFSRALNESLRVSALSGSYASVIGGGPAASVVFPREVRARMLKDPRVIELQEKVRQQPSEETREALDRTREEVLLEKQAEVAAEFDTIHTVERAKEVGSIELILSPDRMRPFLIQQIQEGLARKTSA